MVSGCNKSGGAAWCGRRAIKEAGPGPLVLALVLALGPLLEDPTPGITTTDNGRG